MTTTTIVSVLVGVAVAGLLVVRQLRAQPVNANMRLPLILGIIGLIELTNYLNKSHVGSIAIIALVGSLILATVLGAARAATVHLWMQDGQPWRKGTWLTGTLWIISLAAHFGLDYLVDPHSPNGGVAGRPSCCTSRSPTPCRPGRGGFPSPTVRLGPAPTTWPVTGLATMSRHNQ